MKISIEEIKILCDILLTKAQNVCIDEFEVNTDYYWLVSSDERENVEEKPTLCVGSLVDDLEEIKKVIKGVNEPTVIDFDRLGNILIALGEKISRSDNVY